MILCLLNSCNDLNTLVILVNNNISNGFNVPSLYLSFDISMFCEKCGIKLAKNSAFCPNCGNAVVDVSTVESKPLSKDTFYSREWHEKRARGNRFDILVDENDFILIKFKKHYYDVWFFFIGIFLGIIGGVIWAVIGQNKNTTKRHMSRAAWIDKEGNIFSRWYESSIYLRLPLEAIRGAITLEKNTFTIHYNERKITLKKNDRIESARFNAYIQEHVL